MNYLNDYNLNETFNKQKSKPKKFKNFTEEEVQRKKKTNKKDYSKERQAKTGDYNE